MNRQFRFQGTCTFIEKKEIKEVPVQKYTTTDPHTPPEH
jgi:hypothetical protein